MTQELRGYLASGLTFWSYIKYRLHVHNPEHAKRIRRRLKDGIRRLSQAGAVRRRRSVRGKTAYELRA